ncbi:MAG TPA: ABC transporter substrate-binding protein [Microlunatus sp.]
MVGFSDPAVSRRAMLGLGLGIAAAGVAGCSRFGGGSTSADGSTTLNMIWWGDAERAKSTQAMLDVFKKKNSGISFKTEYQDSGPYKDKMATRFASGDVPDLCNQRRDSIREYADRGALLDLNQHLDALNTKDIPDSVRKIGQVGDKMYGIPAGLNAVGIVINKQLAGKYGVEIPDGDTWSWDDLWAFSRKITKASNKKVYGTDVDFATIQNLVVFVRQTGEELYNEDGSFGASEKTLTDWFSMSVSERKAGGLAPAGFLDASGSAAEQDGLTKKVLASQVIPTNNLKAETDSVGSELQLNRMPGETQGARRGMSIDTSMYWSIAQKSEHTDDALKVLDFIVNDVDGNKAVGPTRGAPMSSKVAEAVYADLGPEDKASVDYISGLSKETLPESRPDPVGGSAVQDACTSIATEVMFGRMKPADAAKQLISKANEALGKK